MWQKSSEELAAQAGVEIEGKVKSIDSLTYSSLLIFQQFEV